MSNFLIVGLSDIAMALCVSKQKAAELIQKEGLPAIRESPGAPWRVLPDDLKTWWQKRVQLKIN